MEGAIGGFCLLYDIVLHKSMKTNCQTPMIPCINEFWIFVKNPETPTDDSHKGSHPLKFNELHGTWMRGNVCKCCIFSHTAIMCCSLVLACTRLWFMIVVFKNFDNHNRWTTEHFIIAIYHSYTGSWNPNAPLVLNYLRHQQRLYFHRWWSVCLCFNDISDTRYNWLIVLVVRVKVWI